MVHASPDSPKKLHSSSFLVTITAVLALLAKRANRLSGKLKTDGKPSASDDWKIELRSPKKSPLARPKKLLSSLSNKTLSFGLSKKKQYEEAEGEWGDGGVWQKAILMGDKCEPLDFSGVIYYDCNGKQMSEIPLRSPRASPLPAYLVRPRDRKL